MSSRTEIEVLLEELHKSTRILRETNEYFDRVVEYDIPKLEGSPSSYVLLSDAFVSFYTCCETAFVRISKFFENNLDKARWHRELLERMTIEVPDFRPRLLSNETCLALEEFLRFRHFKRYYFQFDYDPPRLEYLKSRFKTTLEQVVSEIEAFAVKIEKLASDEYHR